MGSSMSIHFNKDSLERQGLDTQNETAKITSDAKYLTKYFPLIPTSKQNTKAQHNKMLQSCMLALHSIQMCKQNSLPTCMRPAKSKLAKLMLEIIYRGSYHIIKC